MTIPQHLLSLAPSDLPNNRPARFDGGGFGIDLRSFGPGDRGRLARIYASVNSAGRLAGEVDPARAGETLLAVDGSALMRDAQQLGSDTPAAVTGEPRTRRLLHDVRGGGLQVLLGTAELLRLDPSAAELARNALCAARDHAKIMRAGFPALDPERYAADEAARVHGIDGFVSTWEGMALRQGERVVSVDVECEYRGAITGRCLETAAIDRVMYNYVNNAARFTADGRVGVWIFRVGRDLVRWVVHNALSADDRAWLNRATGGDPRALFRGGTTRGGNGVGLSGCADIVASCFGLDPSEVVRDGHLGARADESGYYAWFHWPAHTGSLSEAACGCG